MGEDETLRIDPVSYQRYNLHAEIINSLDTQGIADLYTRFEPLIDEAYIELGYPDRPFFRTLGQAVDSLLAVPIIPETQTLVEHAPLFQFKNELLESLSPAQKQFFGMGPENIRTVQSKLEQVAIALGIPNVS